ncbi:flavin-containing monooxygenase [Ottowia thiooxydans]|uniref:flavin-containing monooxygenase n=1 Tax=Ottowia thiooxydans TaxID=219182 RepID=UPI000688269F|nr:NAD(P)/FAD-dependent oxidoreductase [Ottowia thiooxydans]
MHREDHLRVDSLIIGAGFAGMYAIHKLRKIGLQPLAFEAGNDVGGTWYWNRYPGARCDVESMEYSYSFDNDLQQEWQWSERYASQAEILRYASHVADRFDLRRSIRFSTRVVAAEFDLATDLWTVKTDRGDVVQARFVIMAGGCLSLPRMPDFPGRDSFTGKLYHTGSWPHESVDFSGLRVGVIGTGSSGIQVIPQLARDAAHLTVFQRTPNFSLPAFNRTSDPKAQAWHKRHYAQRRERARYSAGGIAGHPLAQRNALDVSPRERENEYEAAWHRGSTGFIRLYKDLLVNHDANETAAAFVRRKIQEIVQDPAMAERLTPKDHPIGTKRLCLDTDYYDTYNRPNVTLVDVRSDPIEAMVAEGLRTRDALHQLDAIVFATGYDAVTGAVLAINFCVRGGERLATKWAHGPRTYLGLMTAGFPNLFLVTGPGSPSVLTNVIAAIEQHVEWIADCISHLQETGVQRIEADPAFEDDWVAHVNELAASMLVMKANSWYMGANVPGKPRVFMPYPGGLGTYRMKCADVAFKGYEGFALSGQRTVNPELIVSV